MASIDEGALATPWSFYLFCKQSGQSQENYEQNIHKLGSFQSVNGFWSLYSHLKRPNDLDPPTDYHLFRDNIKAIWEDSVNKEGGKWMIRLKKGLASYYWEKLIISLIGEQFPEDVVGAVVSIRFPEDIISLWNRSGKDKAICNTIFSAICHNLALPLDTKLEYKEHAESAMDRSSFRNTHQYKVEECEPYDPITKSIITKH